MSGRSPASDATGLLASYAATLREEDVPSEVLGCARAVLADTLGCMLGGSTSRLVAVSLRAFPPSGSGPCTVVGHGGAMDAQVAAFANAIASHSTDLDDSHAPSRTHPAAVVIPAALAAAELATTCSGKSLLAGIVVGYDVTARLGKAMGVRAPFARGFHSASVCGAVGAAVAAGRILGLGEEQLASCIALGASQSSGLTTFEDDPTHTINTVQMGIAARNGVAAALLARAGAVVATDVLTGRQNMLSAFSPVVDGSQLVAGLRERFEICDTSLKRHACCGQAHAAVDAMLWLRDTLAFRPDDIETIDVDLSHDAFAMLHGTPLWTHNIEYVLSVAAIEGRIGMEHFSREWIESDSVAKLIPKVRARGTDAMQELLPREKGAVVTVQTASGQHSRQVSAPRGNPDDPLSNDELREKFLQLVKLSPLKNDQAVALWDVVADIDTAQTLSPLFELLAIG